MTQRQPPRTALARAKDDLASAEKRRERNRAAAVKSGEKAAADALAAEASKREVTAYRELVRSLGGADEAVSARDLLGVANTESTTAP